MLYNRKWDFVHIKILSACFFDYGRRIQVNYVCELSAESNCKYLNDDGIHCAGNDCCVFCEKEGVEEKENGYRNIRREWWYP